MITIEAPEGALIVPKGMMLSWAMKVLISSLKKDKEFRRSWEANIAMAFKDNWHWYKKEKGKVNINAGDRHVIANKAADYFLKQLCK